MRTEKITTKKGKKKLVRTIVTHLQYNEKDALLIRLVEAMEEMANTSSETLNLMTKLYNKQLFNKK